MRLLEVLLCAVLLGLSLGQKEPPHIPPVISMNEPAQLYKNEGDTFSIECSATGVPRPSVKWEKLTDQVYPEVNVTNVLNFVNSAKEHGGTYQCVATNAHGTAVSGYVNVEIIFLGKLKKENSTVTVTEGDSLVVDCQRETGGVLSNPEPIWSWRIEKDGVELPLEYPRMAIDQEGKLHFAYVNASDADDGVTFVCLAYNHLLKKTVAGSETSLIIKLLTTDIPARKPELSYSNTNRALSHRVKVVKGQKVALYCIFKGYPEFNITWTLNRDGDPLPNEGIALSEGNTKLIVDSSKLPEGFVLACTGENIEGVVESLYDVIFYDPPLFLPGALQLKNVNKSIGADVHFQCEVKAKPSAQLDWLVDNVWYTIENITDPRMTIDRKGNFYLKGLKKTDNQVVTCRAIQTFKKDENFTIFKSGYINVLSPLFITKQPKNSAVVSSFCDVVRLECHIQYDPTETPVVTWYRNGEIVTEYPEQIYKAKNESLIINATKYCLAEQIAGIYHYVAVSPALGEQVESAKSNITLDPNGNFTRPSDNGWEFLGLYLDPWWLWLLILAAILLLLFLLILCICCCCCCRRREKSAGKGKKEEESSDLEAMLSARHQELPTKLDDPDVQILFKKYIIIMGDGSLTEEEDVTIMPQAAFIHLGTRIWPAVPCLKQEDFETCYQSHCTEGEKGLSFQSFHSALNELINTNDSRRHDSLPRRRRKNKIPNFHTKEKVIRMLKIVADPEKDPSIFVNDLKFTVKGLEKLTYDNASPVVTTTTEKVLNGIGYGNFWLLNIAHLTWDLVKVTMNDDTSQKERWSCDCGALQGMFNRSRWHYIRILYEVMEFLNFAKRTELYRSQKIEKYINDLKTILEDHSEHLTHSGFSEPKRVRMQVYKRMAVEINDKFFKRYMWRPAKVSV